MTLATLLISMGAMWGMVTVHAEHPHNGVVTEKVFTGHQSFTNRSFDAIEARLNAIDAKLDQVLRK